MDWLKNPSQSHGYRLIHVDTCDLSQRQRGAGVQVELASRARHQAQIDISQRNRGDVRVQLANRSRGVMPTVSRRIPFPFLLMDFLPET